MIEGTWWVPRAGIYLGEHGWIVISGPLDCVNKRYRSRSTPKISHGRRRVDVASMSRPCRVDRSAIVRAYVSHRVGLCSSLSNAPRTNGEDERRGRAARTNNEDEQRGRGTRTREERLSDETSFRTLAYKSSFLPAVNSLVFGIPDRTNIFPGQSVGKLRRTRRAGRKKHDGPV